MTIFGVALVAAAVASILFVLASSGFVHLIWGAAAVPSRARDLAAVSAEVRGPRRVMGALFCVVVGGTVEYLVLFLITVDGDQLNVPAAIVLYAQLVLAILWTGYLTRGVSGVSGSR